MATLTQEEIFTKVQAVLVDALGVDDDEITGKAVIKDDLGAESIDFLDIIFRLEKAFGIKIGKDEMMPANVTNDPTFSRDGVITPAGIEELKKRMPYSDFTEFEKDPSAENMSKLFTVDVIVRFVEGKLK